MQNLKPINGHFENSCGNKQYNVALYMRMSTDKQENSIESQREVLHRYAKNNKMNITCEYTDEGISGRQAIRRPGFLQMIEDSTKNMFDAVLVYDSSRFARNLEESIVYKSSLKRNGVQLISATEPSLDEDTTIISDAMLGAINEMYSRKLSKSVIRGMTYRAQQGFFMTPAPFGYVNKDNTLEIKENEADIVRRVFDMFLELPSYHSIAVKLNLNGVPKRNNTKWSSTDIKRMLKKITYIGLVEYNGQVYQGKHAAIIDREVYDRVQDLIAQKPNKRTRPSITYKHWLSGLVRCGKCGGRMNYVTDWNGNKSYRCNAHANGRCQYSNFMSVNKLETLALNTVKSFLQNESILNYSYFIPKKISNTDEESLNSAIKKIDLRIKRIEGAYEAGIDTIQEYAEKKKKALKEKEDLKKSLKAIRSNITEEDKISSFKQETSSVVDLLESDKYSIEEKSEAVKSIIEKMVLDKYTGEFTVFYYL